jgi:uncharacterized protein YaiE (UPF0345 family)
MYKLRKYHDDRVMSLTYDSDGKAFSVGIIAEGEFSFGAVVDEHYKITSGKISFWEDGNDKWKECGVNDEFTTHAGKDFKFKASEVSSYICFYK